jgi:hypothetical protein
MIPVSDMETLRDRLRWWFDVYDTGPIRMIGLCFARQASSLARSDILPQLADWDRRTGEHICLFFPGYAEFALAEDSQPNESAGFHSLYYSPTLFDKFRRELEGLTSWKYSGAVDLILLNVRREPGQDPTPDFDSAIVCQLDKMKEDKAFIAVEQFFEEVFRFAEEHQRTADPTWGFSDRKASTSAGTVLKKLVLSLLPKHVAEQFERLEHLAVKSIAKK